MLAPVPDEDIRAPQDEPQTDEPTGPGTEAPGCVGPAPAKGLSHAPPSSTGVPVTFAYPDPQDAPITSGGVEEEDVVPGDLLPELDYPFVKHRNSGGITWFKGPYEIVSGLEWVLRIPRTDGQLGRLPGCFKDMWFMISVPARKTGMDRAPP